MHNVVSRVDAYAIFFYSALLNLLKLPTKTICLLYAAILLGETELVRSNLVPRVSLLCLHCLFSTTMEAEKRDPGNEVESGLELIRSDDNFDTLVISNN